MTYTARCITGGIYETHETVTVDHRLASMPYAQAGVIDHIDHIDYTDSWRGTYQRRPGHTLMSYSTVAATLTDTGILTIDCLCSASTRRHVSAFLREYAPGISYQDAKVAHMGGYAIDIHTGDHIDLKTGEVIDKEAA